MHKFLGASILSARRLIDRSLSGRGARQLHTKLPSIRCARSMRLLFPFLASCGVAMAASSRIHGALRGAFCDTTAEEKENIIGSVKLTKIIQINEVLDESSFKKIIAGAEEKFPGLPVFVLFFAEKCNGASWCPDCTRAEPVLVSSLEQYRQDCVLIVINVNKAEYKTPSYPYRSSPSIKLTCVPTLQRYLQTFVIES